MLSIDTFFLAHQVPGAPARVVTDTQTHPPEFIPPDHQHNFSTMFMHEDCKLTVVVHYSAEAPRYYGFKSAMFMHLRCNLCEWGQSCTDDEGVNSCSGYNNYLLFNLQMKSNLCGCRMEYSVCYATCMAGSTWHYELSRFQWICCTHIPFSFQQYYVSERVRYSYPVLPSLHL